jgi:hypothetical protein
MTIRKPNRVTTPKQAVLNGARTSHASMPRARGRWRRPGSGRRVTTPADFPDLRDGDGTRELRLGGGPADRLATFDASVADAQRRYDGITFVCDEAGQRIAAIVPAEIAEFAIRHGALR